MTVGQIPLGGVTVLSGLNPVMVGSHFLLAMLGLGAAVMALVVYRDDRRGWTRTWDRRRGPFASLAALALLGVVVTGHPGHRLRAPLRRGQRDRPARATCS